ncbi:MAG: hypothetical protein OXR66_02430 [Candidatus Woesearchaeota archaeon]|nr:hypothetical protein [Candidatus Woesearchaeota archaeon]
MPNMTLAVPAELHEEMKQFTEIKWSDVARQAFSQKVQQLKTPVTDEEIDRISHMIKKEVRKHFDSL